MERAEEYKFSKEEVTQLFEAKIGRKVSRIRFSPKSQTLICMVEGSTDGI